MSHDTETETSPGYEIPDELDGLSGETVEFVQGRVSSVHGDHVTVRQSIVSEVSARTAVVRQGIVQSVSAESVDMLQGAVAVARPTSALLRASTVGVCAAEGEVSVDQSCAGVVIARERAELDHSPAVAVIGRQIKADNSSSVFLIAQRVEGSLKTLFGTREALLFGAATGVVLAAAHLLPRIFGRR